MQAQPMEDPLSIVGRGIFFNWDDGGVAMFIDSLAGVIPPYSIDVKLEKKKDTGTPRPVKGTQHGEEAELDMAKQNIGKRAEEDAVRDIEKQPCPENPDATPDREEGEDPCRLDLVV